MRLHSFYDPWTKFRTILQHIGVGKVFLNRTPIGHTTDKFSFMKLKFLSKVKEIISWLKFLTAVFPKEHSYVVYTNNSKN